MANEADNKAMPTEEIINKKKTIKNGITFELDIIFISKKMILKIKYTKSL